ncbi:MAG: hypothetical protein IAE79_12880 [Anaerolinea sp.]|nr:hypothetical protein [Anaerolinea sp.]
MIITINLPRLIALSGMFHLAYRGKQATAVIPAYTTTSPATLPFKGNEEMKRW